MAAIQPTRCTLLECSIGGVPFRSIINGQSHNNFHVQELRIYEDNCKFYFTGQLVIEAHDNTFELYLAPQATVLISFLAPPTSFIYTETFKVYSYESKPREGDIQNAMVVTISLIGTEYFKDKASLVQQNFANIPGSAAAAAIHSAYLSINGGLRTYPSIGMIGQQLHPHQVVSKQPSKAIHDILDKCIFAVPHYGPCSYFRNKPGYVMQPIEYLLYAAPLTGNFLHQPAMGADMTATLQGYDRVIHLRPMTPPGEDRGGARGGEAQGSAMLQKFIDFAMGNADQMGSSSGGSGMSKNAIDSFRQVANIDKNGPGGFQKAEDAFISKLTYSPKYWVSVPLQTGIKVTVGDRVNVTYPISAAMNSKTLWVARLIHELKFTEGKDRSTVTVNGTTDIFGVYYTG